MKTNGANQTEGRNPKSRLPDWVKAMLRLPRDAGVESWRSWRLARLAAQLKEVPPGTQPPLPLLRKFKEVWGNPGWSARIDYLAEVFQYASEAVEPVIECGSGLSTFVLAVASKHSGQPVEVLEHDEAWLKLVKRRLLFAGRHHVQVLHAPLRSYQAFDWYEVDQLQSRMYGLVVCDGPPGSTRGGRYGLLPVISERLGANSLILLDDVERSGEREVLQKWAGEFGAHSTVVRSENRDFAKVSIPGDQLRSHEMRSE